MNKILLQNLSKSAIQAQKKLSGLNVSQRASIEKEWDIEHAYYSSTLEGSMLDRQEFEKLGEMIN